MVKIDCPLCGAPKVITVESGPWMTISNPNSEDGAMGNYEMAAPTDRYDFSHAQVCPKLIGVFYKEDLLMYHCPVDQIIKSDLCSIEDYQDLFDDFCFRIHSVNLREKYQQKEYYWRTSVFIDSTLSPGFLYMETKGNTPDDAFNGLRHRLLCGEILCHDTMRLQMIKADGILNLINLAE